MSPKNFTTYNGFFINHDFDVYKIIDDIVPANHQQMSMGSYAESNMLEGTRVRYYDKKSLTEKFFLPEGVNGFYYECKPEIDLRVLFDIRREYDRRHFGKFYSVFDLGDKIIVKFRKVTDEKEDESQGIEEYYMYVVIASNNGLKWKGPDNRFVPRSYELDAERGDSSERHVYDPLIIKSSKLVIAASTDFYSAIHEADFLLDNESRLKLQAEKRIESFPNLFQNPGKLNHKKIDIIDMETVARAYKHSQNALSGFKCNIHHFTGLYAGFPWFFQYWSRDEGISLKALQYIEEFEFAKQILCSRLFIKDDGRISSRYPESQLGTADGAGWIFKRAYDFIEFLDEFELECIKNRLEKSIKLIEKNYMRNGLIYNHAKETWMDTEFMGDNREGFRIEIQALQLQMYKLAHVLTGKKIYQSKEQKLADKVRKNFYNGSYLADGKGDFTIRPNVFLAYYIYPELLKDSQWENCFERLLSRLWLDWGGLTTIDKTHSLYMPHYSGLDNRSYHRGNSWYFVNHLAAIAMYDLNVKRFKPYIEKILVASSNQIIHQGVIGYCAEVSSSRSRESHGAMAQLWSTATYLELLHKIFGLE